MLRSLLAAALLCAPALAAQAATINEFRPNPPGADPASQTIELSGAAGTAVSGVLVALDGDATGTVAGQVNDLASFSGAFDADGLFTFGVSDLENPSLTLVIAASFAGSVGDDLDADDDGTIDSLLGFGTVFDAIGIADAGADLGLLYGAQLGGTDLATTFEPALTFRDSTLGDLYSVNESGGVFDASGGAVAASVFDRNPVAATFGAVNPGLAIAAVPLPAGGLLLLGALGLLALRRRG